MYQNKLLLTKDSDEWTKLLEKTENPDIYFTPEYAKIYEYNYGKEIDEAFCGTSLLFFFGNKDEFVIYPLIKRKINDLPFMKQTKMPPLFDVISHYGYGGLLVKCDNKKNEKQLLKKFLATFNKLCIENNMVTEFIRFHPLINNHDILIDLIPIDKRNSTVYIDLTQDEQTILKNMNKKTRNLIRKAEKNNVEIKLSTNKKDVAIFTDLYLQTMRKNKADKKYFFPLDFFKNTINLLNGNISLFTAKYDGEIIAASLFMHKYDSLHYHFSGSNKNFMNLAPNNLLLWEVALWGKKQGYKRFHLGGGSSDEDGLFHFKSGFSKNQSAFYTSSIIHNKKIYDQLCLLKDNFEIRERKVFINSDFFPSYRKIVRE